MKKRGGFGGKVRPISDPMLELSDSEQAELQALADTLDHIETPELSDSEQAELQALAERLEHFNAI